MKKGRIHTKAQVDRILTDIHQLMAQNVPDSEIRHTLGLELRQYQYFAKRIHLQNQRIWYDLVKDQIYTQLLLLRSSLQETHKICKALSEKPDSSTGDILDALAAKDSAAISLVQLIEEGPEMLARVEGFLTGTTVPAKAASRRTITQKTK